MPKGETLLDTIKRRTARRDSPSLLESLKARLPASDPMTDETGLLPGDPKWNPTSGQQEALKILDAPVAREVTYSGSPYYGMGSVPYRSKLEDITSQYPVEGLGTKHYIEKAKVVKNEKQYWRIRTNADLAATAGRKRIDEGLKPTTAQWTAMRDYMRVVLAAIARGQYPRDYIPLTDPIGVKEHFGRKTISEILSLVPYSSSGFAEKLGFEGALRRLRNRPYEKAAAAEIDLAISEREYRIKHTPPGIPGPKSLKHGLAEEEMQELRQVHRKVSVRREVEDLMVVSRRLFRDMDYAQRGQTKWATVAEIGSQLPAWMGEFYLGGRMIGARSIAGKAFSGKAAALFARGALRTVAQPHRIAEAYIAATTPTQFQMTEDGRLDFIDGQEKPFTALWKSVGGLIIENMSEEMGKPIVRGVGKIILRIPGMKKQAQKLTVILGKTWIRAGKKKGITRTLKQFGEMLFSPNGRLKPGGFDGLLGEIPEEVLAAAAKSAMDIEGAEGDNAAERVIRTVASLPYLEMGIVFGAIGAGQAVAGRLSGPDNSNPRKRGEWRKDQILAMRETQARIDEVFDRHATEPNEVKPASHAEHVGQVIEKYMDELPEDVQQYLRQELRGELNIQEQIEAVNERIEELNYERAMADASSEDNELALAENLNTTDYAVGQKVRAHDRDNIGTVIAADEGTVAVRFVNPDTEAAVVKTFLMDQVSPIITLGPPNSEIDVTVLATAGQKVRGFGATMGNILTRFRELESEVRQALIAYEENMAKINQSAADRTTSIFAGIDAAGRRAIQLHLDHPGKYPNLPARLQEAAEEIKNEQDEILKILQSLGYLTGGGWPGGQQTFLKYELAKTRKAINDIDKEQPFWQERQGELETTARQIEQQIGYLDELGFVHRITRPPGGPKVINRILFSLRRKTITDRPKGLVERRVFSTIEEAEEAGYKVADILISHSDLLAKAWRAKAANDLLAVVNLNSDLSRPEGQAPGDWVRIDNRALPSGKGRLYAPAMADAIGELTYSSDTHFLWKWYDKFNTALKMVGFYNPFIMTKNDLYQGWRASGLRFFANIPRAVSIWKNKGAEYDKYRMAGLFHGVISYGPSVDEVARQMLLEVEGTFGQKTAAWLGRYMHPQHPIKSLMAINQVVTWNVDEILRIAAARSLEDGRLAKHFGFTDFELIEQANDFMANYGKVPIGTRKALNRLIFTPTYRISMARVLAQMYRHPKILWPMLARHYAYKLFVHYVLPGLTAMWVTGEWDKGRSEKGYRIVVRGEYSGEEIVFTLSDPLLEEEKALMQPFLNRLQYQSSAALSFFIGAVRGPSRKSDDKFAHLFKLGTPIWRDIRIWADTDRETAHKIIQQLGIAWVYKRRARPGDNERADSALDKALWLIEVARDQAKHIAKRQGWDKKRR